MVVSGSLSGFPSNAQTPTHKMAAAAAAASEIEIGSFVSVQIKSYCAWGVVDSMNANRTKVALFVPEDIRKRHEKLTTSVHPRKCRIMRRCPMRLGDYIEGESVGVLRTSGPIIHIDESKRQILLEHEGFVRPFSGLVLSLSRNNEYHIAPIRAIEELLQYRMQPQQNKRKHEEDEHEDGRPATAASGSAPRGIALSPDQCQKLYNQINTFRQMPHDEKCAAIGQVRDLFDRIKIPQDAFVGLLHESLLKFFLNGIRPKPTAIASNTICSVCYEFPISHTPGCGHLFCESCVSKLALCPLCRAQKTNVSRIYLP